MRCNAGPQEDHGADQGRDRVARQARAPGRADTAEHQRLARPHGDLPEVELEPLLAQHALHQIVVADRGAAGGDEQVGAGGAVGHPARARRGRPARCRDRSARRRRRARRRRGPRPLELTIWFGPSGSPGITTSSPVARMATRGLRRTVQPGHGSSRRRGRCRARSARRPASRHRPRPRGNRGRRGGCSVPWARLPSTVRCARRRRLGVLLDDDRVGAVGHRRAGEDAHRLARRRASPAKAPPAGACRRPSGVAGSVATSAARTA